MKIVDYNLVDIDIEDAIDILLKTENDLSNVYLNQSVIDSYKIGCDINYQTPEELLSLSDITGKYSEKEYYDKCINNWYIPNEYKKLNLKTFFYYKIETLEQKSRVDTELSLIKQYNLENMFRALIYLVDIFTINNILWGVGRGSSVSLYTLYLMDLHLIDSIKYDLDPNEFFKINKED